MWKRRINGEIVTAPVLAEWCVYLATLDGAICCFRLENGVAFPVAARLHWGLCYLVGLAHLLVAALMPLWLNLAPLIDAVFVAVCMFRAA
jgi:hypothetical protein